MDADRLLVRLLLLNPQRLLQELSVTTPISCFGGNATVTLIAIGGTAPYSFTFNGVTQVGNGVFTNIPAGVAYPWSVTDANGCGPVAGTLTVTQPSALAAGAVVTSAITCFGGNATVTLIAIGGTAPYSFTFNGVTQIGNGVFTNIPAGVAYPWSVTDANGCGPVAGTLTVTQPSALAAGASVTSAITCFGGTATVTLTASGGTAPYSFTFNGVTQVGNGVFTNIPAGVAYPWSVTDANGCGPVAGTLTVTQPSALAAGASVTSAITCFGGTATVTLIASGGTAPYSFTFNGVTQVGNGVFTNIPAGVAYPWSVTDANGCGPVAGTLTVTQPSALAAGASVTSAITCFGGTATVTLTASGGTAPYSFTFNGVTQVGNGVFTNIPAGVAYPWSVTDANGCGPVAGTLTVTQPSALAAGASVTSAITCFGGTAIVTLTASGGTAPYSFTFNGVTQVGNGVFTNIPAGVAYPWSVTNANGCGPVAGTLTVTQPSALAAGAVVTSAITCFGGNATVTLIAIGGTAPYSFTFNGVTQIGNGVFTNIPAGVAYPWSVTDANGCGPVAGTLTVTQPSALAAGASVTTPITCFGGTATVTLTAIGGQLLIALPSTELPRSEMAYLPIYLPVWLIPGV